MTDEITKSGNAGADGPFGHGNYEHQDLGPKNIVYFLVTLLAITALCMVGLKGLYAFLDHRVRETQPAVNPLVTNAPKDTLHIRPGYPQTAFPSPRLEEDERGQLTSIRQAQDDTLYTYGWVDEKAGIARIPIDRAMDLLVQRGLPVRPQEAANSLDDAGNDMAAPAPAAKASGTDQTGTGKKGEMK
jgi:hypothetical protein